MKIEINHITDKFSFTALIESKNTLTHSSMTDYPHKEHVERYLRQICAYLTEELDKYGPKKEA
jgi:hypothetical protein